MTNLGKISYFLGMEFAYTVVGLVIHQKKYTRDLVKRFNMSLCNATISPMEVNQKLVRDESEEGVNETIFKQIIGSLRFPCNNRPDLSFCVGLISRFMGELKSSHECCQTGIEEMMMPVKTPLQLRIDNISVINLSKNPVSHGRSKHLEVKYHFLRDLVSKGRIVLSYCRTEEQLEDIFTKALKVDRFDFLKKIGVISLDACLRGKC
ncbi:uncharacterized protein LOC128197530 [Vigna angularis]|uniref:uncharacterized protein LOC128197530 n=1 Tax=Phaseolus angularis TaxID=3914 RepID=UPI0022B4F8D7|nr:uncharacterized protein LOC128197530 [Vigna angularis]